MMKLPFYLLLQEVELFSVKIQTQPFSQEEFRKKIHIFNCGAIVSFTGIVRGFDEKEPLDYLYLEHFPSVTEQEIERIIHLAKKRWDIQGCQVIHRVGNLRVGEEIVLVLTAASHRKAAFEAAEFIMDYLKSEAPFWKKEFFRNGQSRWVRAKSYDLKEKERWSSHE